MDYRTDLTLVVKSGRKKEKKYLVAFIVPKTPSSDYMRFSLKNGKSLAHAIRGSLCNVFTFFHGEPPVWSNKQPTTASSLKAPYNYQNPLIIIHLSGCGL